MKKEILSPVCCFSYDGRVEEVHVLETDCPIKRDLGKSVINDKEHCLCVYRSGFDVIKPCENYLGYKKVQRNKRTEYKILCNALEGAE